MARERMVTRTISNTTATVKAYDFNIDEKVIMEIDLGGTDPEQMTRKHWEKLMPPGVVFGCVVSTTTIEQIYAMTETEFLKHAKPYNR